MMVLVRNEPGGLVPVDDLYVLVGHYGEPTNLVVWRQQGERFPAAAGADDVVAPVSFVRLIAEGPIRTAMAA